MGIKQSLLRFPKNDKTKLNVINLHHLHENLVPEYFQKHCCTPSHLCFIISTFQTGIPTLRCCTPLQPSLHGSLGGAAYCLNAAGRPAHGLCKCQQAPLTGLLYWSYTKATCGAADAQGVNLAPTHRRLMTFLRVRQ